MPICSNGKTNVFELLTVFSFFSMYFDITCSIRFFKIVRNSPVFPKMSHSCLYRNVMTMETLVRVDIAFGMKLKSILFEDETAFSLTGTPFPNKFGEHTNSCNDVMKKIGE